MSTSINPAAVAPMKKVDTLGKRKQSVDGELCLCLCLCS